MKGVIDYIFPVLILHKIHFQEKLIQESQKKKNITFKLPFEKVDDIIKNKNRNQTLKLSKSFYILNYKRNQSI